MLEVDVRLNRGLFKLDAHAVWSGGLLGMIGPSGCGKTTLLHTIAGLVRPEAGRVALNDQLLFDGERRVWVPPHRRAVAVAFQDDRLWSHRSVLGNLMFGYRRTPPARRRFGPEQVTDWLDLGPLLHRGVANLSGGERRRVSLARALLTSPELLLLDEPTSGLDVRMCDRVLELIGRTVAASRVPTIMVSHQVEHLLRLTDELLVMHDGRVVSHGPVSSVIAASRGLVASEAVTSVNRVPLSVAAHRPAAGITELQPRRCGQDPTARLRAVVDPELPVGSPAIALLSSDQIVLAMAPVETVSMQNRLRGRVVQLFEQGESILCLVDAAGFLLSARITRQARDDFGIRPGVPMWCLFKASALRVFADVAAGSEVAGPAPRTAHASPAAATRCS